MKNNEVLKAQIIQIIENQIRDNDPVEINLTFKRLLELGYDNYDSKQLIGQCVAVELFDVIKHKKAFDEVRYIRNLKKLPKEPFD